MNKVLYNEVYKDGELVPATLVDRIKKERFLQSLKEGDRVESYTQVTIADKSNAQLAMLHALIRELSNHSGHSFAEIKMMVKTETGLVELNASGELVVKSFADCSKLEISQAIQTCLEIGEKINCELL